MKLAVLAWLKARIRRLPGAIALAHGLRPHLVGLLGERHADRLISAPVAIDYAALLRGVSERPGTHSLVVASANAEAGLGACLEQFSRAARASAECVVIDDASSDRSVEVARQHAARDRRIRVVAHRAPGGVAAACNSGLLLARGELVGFVDPGRSNGPHELMDREWHPRAALIAAGGLDECARQLAPRQPNSGDAPAFDVLFFPHKPYHVWTAAMVMAELDKLGVAAACVDLTCGYGDEGARGALARYGVPSISLNAYLLRRADPKAVVCFNDWDTHVVRPVIEHCNRRGVATVGMVEGVQDFADADTGRGRRPYQTVQHVLLAGRHDRQFFPGAETRLHEVGVPRIDALLSEPVSEPRAPLVVVNQNFSYGVLAHEAAAWLDSVVRACAAAGLDYVVSQHPADLTSLDGYETSDLDFYELIRRGSVLVSRFSSCILEALALGKPVVYHNPHGERVVKFQESRGAYATTDSVEALRAELCRLKGWQPSVREQASAFLAEHCGTGADGSAAARAAARIRDIGGC